MLVALVVNVRENNINYQVVEPSNYYEKITTL